MSNREWIYQTMVNDPTLISLLSVSGKVQVFQTSRLTEVPKEKPFVIYRFTSDVALLGGDDNSAARSQGLMIFAHDDPGDYGRVEEVLGRIKQLFHNAINIPNHIIRCRHIDSSEDLSDPAMATITKYCRFQIIYKG